MPTSTLAKGNFFSFFSYWKIASPDFKKLMIGLLALALINSSDVFLLLKTKEITGSDSLTIGAYIFYNLVYALASYPLGILADKIGLKKVFVSGLLLFAIVYFLFGLTSYISIVFLAFFLYGIYAAATEGISKAWITNLTHNKNTATAIGFYTSGQSICSFLASAITGLLWSTFNSSVAFFATSFITVGIIFFFTMAFKTSSKSI